MGSLTVWAPSLQGTTLSSEQWGIVHAQTVNTIRVIENLTPVQKKLLGESININEFYPHIGIFSKDYFVSTVLLKK